MVSEVTCRAPIRSRSISSSPSFTEPRIYAMATSVLLSSPTQCMENTSSVERTRLRIRLALNSNVSTKPSRDPLVTRSRSGSAMPLAG